MQNDNVKFEILHMPPANTNSVLVYADGDAVIFDPWGRADEWVRVLDERGLKLRAIYATHGHSDHISAAPDLAARFDVPWYLNSGDHDLIWWGNGLLEYFNIPQISTNCKMPENLDAGRCTVLPGVDMDIILTPGHSAGGVAFYFPDFKILFIGDTLFQDSVGRTDLPGGDIGQLRASVRKIQDMNLPYDTFVVHGHGMDSTIDWLNNNHPWFLMRHCKCGDGGCCGEHTHHCCGGGNQHCCCHDDE